jgi:hypothetical protein
VLLACLFFTPLIGMAYFWWCDTSPQRTGSLLALCHNLVWVLGVVLLEAALVSLAGRVLHRF